jgi:DNA mismatch repair ATPase MutL
MGFRGEALPAIASVSRMRIDTADGSSGAAGTRLVLEGGRVVEHGPRARLAADPTSRFHDLLQVGLEPVLA